MSRHPRDWRMYRRVTQPVRRGHPHRRGRRAAFGRKSGEARKDHCCPLSYSLGIRDASAIAALPASPRESLRTLPCPPNPLSISEEELVDEDVVRDLLQDAPVCYTKPSRARLRCRSRRRPPPRPVDPQPSTATRVRRIHCGVAPRPSRRASALPRFRGRMLGQAITPGALAQPSALMISNAVLISSTGSAGIDMALACRRSRRRGARHADADLSERRTSFRPRSLPRWQRVRNLLREQPVALISSQRAST